VIEPGRYKELTLTHGRQIRRAKKKATLNDKRIKTCIDKFAAGVYRRYEFLYAVSHVADNLGLPTAQLEDVSSSDDDTEMYDVDEALAAVTSTSSVSVPSDAAAHPVATVDPAVCEVCLIEPKAAQTLPLL